MTPGPSTYCSRPRSTKRTAVHRTRTTQRTSESIASGIPLRRRRTTTRTSTKPTPWTKTTTKSTSILICNTRGPRGAASGGASPGSASSASLRPHPLTVLQLTLSLPQLCLPSRWAGQVLWATSHRSLVPPSSSPWTTSSSCSWPTSPSACIADGRRPAMFFHSSAATASAQTSAATPRSPTRSTAAPSASRASRTSARAG
mmetsp:Transcript_9298/g.38189  ORF Transcript_9298/g.38189 Transcript_9298/m.38189 type:complete len:201 (+) Transcript_9298:430-1032(+)